jgi:hypothetical protein
MVITRAFMQRLPKSIVFVVLRCGIFAVVVTGSSTAFADVADLAREIAAVRSTLDKAAADAEAGRLLPLRSSLKKAQESWSRFFVGYRGWGSGTDPAWMTDMDAIQTEFMNATNAVTPGNNAPLAATTLGRIQEMLAGLLDRNSVPDVDKAVKELSLSLAGIQTSMKTSQGKAIGPDTLAALSNQWTEISEAWTALNKALIETNALNLNDRELAALQQRTNRQSALFDVVGNALGNANLASGLASINSAVEGLRALAAQWGDTASDSTNEPLDSQPKRRVNFR